MHLSCIYAGHGLRDERSGFTCFSVRPLPPYGPELKVTEYQTVNIRGIIQNLPKATPLNIECEDVPLEGRNGFYYRLVSYSFSADAEAVKDFLLASSLSGIGKETAKKITASIADLFEFVKQENAQKKIEALGIKEESAAQLVGRIKEMVDIRCIMTELAKYGADYASAVRYYEMEKTGGYNIDFDKRPYSLLYAGIPFETCDFIASKKKHGQYKEDRLCALARSAYIRGTFNGDTKLSFENFAKACRYLERSASSGYMTEPVLLLPYLNKCRLKMVYEDAELFVYDNSVFEMEESIAGHICRLNRCRSENKVSEEQIEKIEKELGIRYSEEQKSAFLLLKKCGLKVLTGGPGTGKTTVVNGLIRLFSEMNPGKNIMLCAPTGCAAKRLSETTGQNAQTIHKLLDIKPFGDSYIQARNETNQLSADMLIVDEASMVGTELMFMLLKAVKNNALVLLVGDEDQLPPVDKGNTLHDILNDERIESCRLRKVYRQSNESPIIANSAKIRNGRCDLVQSPDFRILRCASEDDIKEKVLRMTKYDVKDPYRTRIYSPVKKTSCECSTVKINCEMHERYSQADSRQTYSFGKYKRFAKNDPVIFTENDYSLGVCNGDLGIITAIYEENGKPFINILTQEGENIEISGADIKNIDLAYSITVHKSQGGECDTAVIILPQQPMNMLQRSLVYVAVTRAKKNVIILSEGDALEKAIQNGEKQKRCTGLNNRIKETFNNI